MKACLQHGMDAPFPYFVLFNFGLFIQKDMIEKDKS